ncbi:hypothetical protein JNW88_28180 [Micromonospora sp. ATA32]|nr:hypothetical protein [Micromonospora sp. ATA32]
MPIPAGPDPITLNPTTTIGQVRLLITDTTEPALFDDNQIDAFLTMEGNVKLAAAAALETIATSEALVSKRITTQDLSTDGPAVSKELRARAAALRQQAAAEVEVADGFGLEIVDFDPYAAYRDRL